MSQISIVGMDKAFVLLYLYNYAFQYKRSSPPVSNMKILVALNGFGFIARAQDLIKDNMSFEEVDLGLGPRKIPVNLELYSFDTQAYDQLYSEGQAKRAIEAAKQACVQSMSSPKLDAFGEPFKEPMVYGLIKSRPSTLHLKENEKTPKPKL